LQAVLLLTLTKGFGGDDDLMFAVDCGDAVVSLNRAFA
jgi:hypothetical protein